MEFSTLQLFEIAKIIDNEYIGKFKTFAIDKVSYGYLISTRKCDWCSFIRIIIDNNKITKILVLNNSTDGYKEIMQATMAKINNYLRS